MKNSVYALLSGAFAAGGSLFAKLSGLHPFKFEVTFKYTLQLQLYLFLFMFLVLSPY